MKKHISIKFILLIGLILSFLTGCTELSQSNDVNAIIEDSSKFSRITSSELLNILGDPTVKEQYQWKVPKTGQSIIGERIVFDKDKNDLEFLVFDNTVARLNIHSEKYNDLNGTSFEFTNDAELFKSFGVTISDALKKTVDNGFALRYSPVSDKIADIWIPIINNNEFDEIKITYNLNYF